MPVRMCYKAPNLTEGGMDDVARILDGLRVTRPSLTVEQLLALDAPRAEFEAHVPMNGGLDVWIYTVNGSTLDGDAMVVRAALVQQAERLAQEGLRHTIQYWRDYADTDGDDASAGLQATVEVMRSTP